MTATFDPIFHPVDFIVLGGFQSPGLAEVQDLKLTFNWEARKGDNVSGASKVFKGRDLTTFKVAFKLFTSEDIAAYEVFVKQLRYADGSKAKTIKGLDVVHPLCSMYEIKAVTIQGFGPLAPVGDGSWEASMDLEEYREPVVTAAKANGARATKKPDDASPIANNPELDAAQKRLASQEAVNKGAGL